ncbi:MAG TPA: hypothetical protein DEE98_05525 [Elusimicrobia bacterium]|nr:MAG: hypothetical protein A2278_01620 [Elusimicrobia bacterium RIFOXYA12_FULL_49_49]OGS11747.1 MAG: hypothetical protein A2386_01655 [Elusimicrobia bacterium RIFOXYB1_FULL_48_9]OGS16747.1 MAG: hypothetical protein A2251_05070 [Elusimicrobia bacterium RIFOXYA2_FULL_47_53]OGS27028.1 MAG: hypothetical protein A2339_04925 [Elusimicrobia bacterium RIFOXYB12_FULL_50_12]OGS31975.1 MAG: hypothetical protein A2323_07845 [Elusimicrobia bacterium RIFOXYB2_FULL_46_23]HBU69827.1 hypothetical protein [El
MKIVYRYLISEFIKPLVFSTVSFGGLVMISEFFRELNYFMEKKAGFFYVFEYLFLNLPWWTIQVLPVSVLLAVLFSLGQFAKQGEITAMKAAGINLWRVIGILLFCGLLIGAGEAVLRENVIPLTVKLADKVRKEKIQNEKVDTQTQYNDLVISLPSNARMTIGGMNAANGSMSKVVVDYYDGAFNLSRQIVSDAGVFKNGEWVFSAGVEREFSGGAWTEQAFAEKALKMPFKPQDFVIERVRPEQMTTKEYLRYIGQLETLGIPSEKEKIIFNLRWSSVFSHIVVMLIGIPFALGLGSKHGKMLSFSFALIFAFIYWGFQAVGQSLGENKVISPLLAAWLGNMVFGAAGLLMISKIRK